MGTMMNYKTSSSNEQEEAKMTIPTIKELIENGTIVKIETIDKLQATCKKCGKSWLLRFNRISIECYICKCKNWWLEKGKKGRPFLIKPNTF